MNWGHALTFVTWMTGVATLITGIVTLGAAAEGESKLWLLLPGILFVIFLVSGLLAMGLGA